MPGVFLGRAVVVPKGLESISYLWPSVSLNEPETLPCRIRGESSGQIGQQDLRFVRRGVSYCSAVARGFLPRLGPLPQGERPLSFALRRLARRRLGRRTYSAAAR